MPRLTLFPIARARHAAPRPPVGIRIERSLGIFVGMNRTALALLSVAACGSLAAMPVLPAEAQVIELEVETAALQSFRAPAAALEDVALQRDAWSVTVFSLVKPPVPPITTLSSDFGPRSCAGCSDFHQGIDYNPGNGFPVEAIADGVVVVSEFSGALGAHVVIEHVIDGQVVRSGYAHMQGESLAVAAGQTVTIGQHLGLVGSTGQSTGPHLHFTIEIGGELIDPQPWLAAHVNTPY